MEDFQTENTVNVGGIVALGGNIATTTKPTIGFSDFIGVGGEANEAAPVKQKVCVQEFNDLFARVYELNRENSNLTGNSVKSLKDYQNLLLTDIDFDHKKEQPLLEALSGLVDCLIILPQFFKAAIGYDPITDEDLTDQECQDLVIDGCFQTVLLGAGAGAGLMASAAEKAAAKAVAVEVASAGEFKYVSQLGEMPIEDAIRYDKYWNLKEIEKTLELSKIEIIDGKVGGKIPVDEYVAIRQSSIKNPNADSMTLGKFTNDADCYIAKAGNDSSYFDLGNDWNKIKKRYGLSDKEMFENFNKYALDEAVSSGKTIRFAQNPLNYGECTLKDEWSYLQDKYGYTRLKNTGDYWYAK